MISLNLEPFNLTSFTMDKNSQKIKKLEKALAESEKRLSIIAGLSYDVL